MIFGVLTVLGVVVVLVVGVVEVCGRHARRIEALDLRGCMPHNVLRRVVRLFYVLRGMA